MTDDAAFLKAVKMLGFDPKTMGPLAHEILSTDLKRRFRKQGYIKTFEKIRRVIDYKDDGNKVC